MGKRWKDGYSASVELYLLLGGERLGVAQVGPDSFILKEECEEIPRGAEGCLVIIIDGRKKSHPIVLHHGAMAGCEEVAYR